MPTKHELTPTEREIVEKYRPEVNKLAYETYLRRIACGCLTCSQFMNEITDIQLGEYHVLQIHGKECKKDSKR